MNWKLLLTPMGGDLDSQIPFHPEKDGYGVFSALATFALAESAALTVVAREERHKTLVLVIYTVSVAITFCWTVAMLRAEVKHTPSPGASVTRVRAYDEPTIRYGRWVLFWIVLLGCVLFYLGKQDLLPNQTPRVQFAATDVLSDTYYIHEWKKKSSDEQKEMDRWIERLSQTARQQSHGEGFFLIVQRSVFPDSLKPFSLSFECNANYYLGARAAFLVRPAERGYRPTYRQIPFRDPQNQETSQDVLSVDDAARDEYIFILVFARDRDQKRKEVPTKQSLDAKLKSNLPGEKPAQ